MKYKNIFITGSTGVVGKPLLKKLIENGHEVYALSRSEESRKNLESQGVSVITGDILTSKVTNTDTKGIIVKPEGSEIEVFIKKNQLASSPSDQRPGRWVVGDRVDSLLEKKEKRRISLSIRMLEEKQNADALEKYGDSSSGKSLPFASLSEEIKKKKKETE